MNWCRFETLLSTPPCMTVNCRSGFAARGRVVHLLLCAVVEHAPKELCEEFVNTSARMCWGAPHHRSVQRVTYYSPKRSARATLLCIFACGEASLATFLATNLGPACAHWFGCGTVIKNQGTAHPELRSLFVNLRTYIPNRLKRSPVAIVWSIQLVKHSSQCQWSRTLIYTEHGSTVKSWHLIWVEIIACREQNEQRSLITTGHTTMTSSVSPANK